MSITHVKTGLRMVKTPEDVNQQRFITLRDMLSDLSFTLPVESECQTCNLVWEVSDFSQLSHVRRYELFWRENIGFYCPECHDVVFLFDYGSGASDRQRTDAWGLREYFRPVPKNVRCAHKVKNMWWKFTNRKRDELFLNDNPTKVSRASGLDIDIQAFYNQCRQAEKESEDT